MTSIRFLWNDGIWEFCAVKQKKKKERETEPYSFLRTIIYIKGNREKRIKGH